MVKNLKIGRLFFLFVPTLLFVFSCQEDNNHASPIAENRQNNSEPHGPKHPTYPVNNGIVIFIDKSSSVQDVPVKESGKGSEWIFSQIKPLVNFSGGKVIIYFIHKSLESASPFFEGEFAVPDTRKLTAFPKRRALDAFGGSIDSLKLKIKEAIETPIEKEPGEETDLFISLKKANDRFAGLPADGKKVILYYSDMIESVKDTRCGKNYQYVYFKTVPEAETTGKKDAVPIRKCYGLENLPHGTVVSLYIPTGSLELNKHRHIPDYWRALFEEFGVKEFTSNL